MEISTERTIIRNFESKDFNDLFEYLSLPEIYRFEPGEPVTLKQAERMGFKREGVLEKNIYFKEVDGKPVWLDTAVYGLLNKKRSSPN